MRTNTNIILSIIELLKTIDLIKANEMTNDKDKKELFNYINDEYFNIDEYKELLLSIKLNNEDVFEIIHQLINLISNHRKINEDILGEVQNNISEASNYGFTWPDSSSCFNKVQEEFIELKNAIKTKNENNIKEEIGDLIFTLQCYANLKNYSFVGILDDANKKFKKRFNKLKEIASKNNLDLKLLSSKEKEKLWQKVKKDEKSSQ